MTSLESPLFKKRSKARTGLGPRDNSLASGTEPESTPEASPDTLATKVKKASRVKPKSRLSFGADEDEEGGGETFQVKKSALSRKIKTASPLVSLVAEEASTPRQDAPLYSKAYLSELKAQTQSTPPPPRSTVQDSEHDMAIDDSTFSDASMQLASMDTLPDPGETIIPSESSIVAAKQKRDRLRKTGGASEDDFISLEVTKRSSTKDDGPHPESRLVREEDELGEGDDDMPEYTGAQERIALGKKGRKADERKRRAGMIEMIEDAQDDVDDEEAREWEMAQVRRAADADREMNIASSTAKATYTPAHIPAAIPIPTLGLSIAAFDKAVLNVTTAHATNSSTLSKLEEERTALQTQEADLRKMVADAEAKRLWFSEFRDWVETVASFLDEKFPLLEKVEAEHLSILTERADILRKRRREDDEDDLALFLGASVFPHPSGDGDAQEITPIIRGERRLARQKRRASRRQRGIAVNDDEEGYSTDASLPSDEQADFAAALANLDAKRTAVLADVQAPEFRDPRLGLAVRFGEWRTKFSENYTEAFGGLGMVNSWEFWARLELVGWNPAEDTRGLDTFEWYTALYAYSRPRQPDTEDEDESDLGPDGDLASSMVSTAVVGRMCKLIEAGGLDPYSTAHIRRIVDVVESVEAALLSESAKFYMLLKSVVAVFRTVVSSTALLVRECVNGNSQLPAFDPLAPPARRRFLARRLKLLRNLVRWRKYTGEKFGAGELITQLLRECMLPIAESGWDVGGQDIMRKAVVGVPAELVPVELRTRL